MKEQRKREEYHAYLLRLWREEADLPWRATLHDPHTGEQQGFASIAQLFAYIAEQTGERPFPHK